MLATRWTCPGRRLADAVLPAVLLGLAFVLPAAPLNGAAPPAAKAEKAGVYALVIGVGKYDGIEDLKQPPQKAKLVAEAVRKTYPGIGDNLKLMLDGDATQAAVEKVLYKDFPKAPNNSLFIFYFAGHGVRWNYPRADRSLSRSDCHLVLSGGTTDAPWGHSVRTDQIVDSIRRSGRCNWMILLDCCQSGPDTPNIWAFSDEERRLLGVKAFMFAAAHRNMATESGIFTDAVLDTLADRNAGCLKPTDLESRVQAQVNQSTKGTVFPQLVFGSEIKTCFANLNEPAFMLVCEPHRGYLHPLTIRIDGEEEKFDRAQLGVYCRQLSRAKPHRLQVTYFDEVLVPDVEVVPPKDGDVDIIVVDKQSSKYPANADPEAAAVAMRRTAEFAEAFGANPRAEYYRAAAGAAGTAQAVHTRQFLQKVLDYSPAGDGTVPYQVAAMALGKEAIDLGAVGPNRRLATELTALGEYNAAGKAFRVLARNASDPDERMEYYYGSILNYKTAGSTDKLLGTGLDVTVSKLSGELSDEQSRYLGRMCFDTEPAHLMGHVPLIAQVPKLAGPRGKKVADYVWALDTLPPRSLAAKNDIKTEFKNVLAKQFADVDDPNAALVVSLTAVDQYVRRKVIDKPAAQELAVLARRRWAASVGIAGGAAELTPLERQKIEASKYPATIFRLLKEYEQPSP